MQTPEQPSVPPLPWSKANAPAVMEALERSGLSVAKFAQLHNVPKHRINYWRDKLKQKPPALATRLLPVNVRPSSQIADQPQAKEAAIELLLPNRIVVRIHATVNQLQLSCVLQACGVQL
jgi:hypothetical protein